MQLLANTTSPFVRIARIAMIEKGLEIEPTIVDPWADDARLRQANAAAENANKAKDLFLAALRAPALQRSHAPALYSHRRPARAYRRYQDPCMSP